jgi:hypothetical protein
LDVAVVEPLVPVVCEAPELAPAQKPVYHAWIDVMSAAVAVQAASQTPETPVEKGETPAWEQKHWS